MNLAHYSMILVLLALFTRNAASHEVLVRPLGMSTFDVRVPDHMITASSWQPGRSEPWYGRVDNQTRRNWCATIRDTNQFIQIDLGPKERTITAVASQGAHNHDEWVTQYTLLYSKRGDNWTEYQIGGTTKVFTGNSDRKTIIKHVLEQNITATYVRFNPRSWSGDICMRVEVYGEDGFSEPLGIASGTIKDSRITPSRYDWGHKYPRLHGTGRNVLRLTCGPNHFVNIDLGPGVKTVASIATQGWRYYWVETYSVAFSKEGTEYFKYREDGTVKVFPGNYDPGTVVKHSLKFNLIIKHFRFYILTWYGPEIRFRVELYGGTACLEPLGLASNVIPNSVLTGSSILSAGTDASKARLYGASAWCAKVNDPNQFIDVDLGSVWRVTRVDVQGNPNADQWVTKYTLKYSLNRIDWLVERKDGRPTEKEIKGNSDRNSVVPYLFEYPTKIRYIRVTPLEWNGHICLRMELYGCEACTDSVGLELDTIPDAAITASSYLEIDFEPWRGRLHHDDGEGTWCALENDLSQYLQVDLQQVHRITAVATQGKTKLSMWALTETAWVTEYSLAFSTDGFRWTPYIVSGNSPRVFTGNSKHFELKKHFLKPAIYGRYLRFLPLAWHNGICMRVGIFGCKDCVEPLGLERFHISNSAMRSSPHVGNGNPHLGRLYYFYYGNNGWRKQDSVRDAYLQIDLGLVPSLVSAVATAGQGKHSVTKYKLAFSRDQYDWFEYREDEQVKVFECPSSELFTAKRQYLKRNVTARLIRFMPIQWNLHPKLKVEVYGIKGFTGKSLSAANQMNPALSPVVSSYNGQSFQPVNNNPELNTKFSWCATQAAVGNFLQFNFKRTVLIYGLIVQTHHTDGRWVTLFTMAYSVDGFLWKDYKTGKNAEVFQGNSWKEEILKHVLKYQITARYLQIHPKEWHDFPCLRIQVIGDEACKQPLGVENGIVEDAMITASSWYSWNYEPFHARLHGRTGEGGWCAKYNDNSQYLQVELGLQYKVTGLATQARYPVKSCGTTDYAWVMNYTLQYRLSDRNWENYTENGIVKIFSGNQDPYSVSYQDLREPVEANFIRFLPTTWYKKICMRVEIFGCNACFNPMGMENYEIPDSGLDATSGYASRLRLFINVHGGWYGGRESNHYVEITMGYVPKIISAIGTQGNPSDFRYVTSYTVSYSRDKAEWFDYKHQGETKVFTANDAADVLKINHLHRSIVAAAVRISPKSYYHSNNMRVELYGCKCEECSSALGMGSGNIPNGAITSSSFDTAGHEPYRGRHRLSPMSSNTAWCAAAADTNPYLRIDLGRTYLVTGLGSESVGLSIGRVQTFKISFSEDGRTWRTYSVNGKHKIFAGDKNIYSGTRHELRFPFTARYVKFLPLTWDKLACMRVEVYGREECGESMGISSQEIPNEAFTASSVLSSNYMPWFGRLGASKGGGAWCAKDNNSAQFLKIDMGRMRKITHVEVQGKGTKSILPNLAKAWVKTFTLGYSSDDWFWKAHKGADSKSKVLEGNNNAEFSVRTSVGSVPIVARYIKIKPVSWHVHICMRVELYGCTVCSNAVGLEDKRVPDQALKGLFYYNNYGPERARLNDARCYLYYPKRLKNGVFLQVDFGAAGKTISAVATQSRPGQRLEMVRSYKLQYSTKGYEWTSYTEKGQVKIFKGNTRSRAIVKNYLQHNITTRYIRIVPVEWNVEIALRVEFYGCDVCESDKYGIGQDNLKSTFTASSFKAKHEPAKADMLTAAGSWCAAQNNVGEFLQAEFEEVKTITRMAVQGHHSAGEWVSKISFKYSIDGANWYNYSLTSGNAVSDPVTVFPANSNHDELVQIDFPTKLEARYVKLFCLEWSSHTCLQVQFYGHKVCAEPLGMENSKIPNTSITASSWRAGPGYEPWNARLNRRYGAGGWCAAEKNIEQYIQVDLERKYKITQLALQRVDSKTDENIFVVTKFKVCYNSNGQAWSEYLESGKPKMFVLNRDSYPIKSGIKRYIFKTPVVAQLLRVNVQHWYNDVCLRMELYGCKACMEPLGMENYQIPSSNIKVSSGYYPWQTYKSYARLGFTNNNGWKPYYHSNVNQWFRVDLGKPTKVSAVGLQGKPSSDSLVTKYLIRHSLNGSTWMSFQHQGKEKIFDGFVHLFSAEILVQYLPQIVTTRFIKIFPHTFDEYINLKFEIYGCH